MKALYLLNEQLVDELGKGIPERNSYRWTVIDNLKEAIEELEIMANRTCDGCKHLEAQIKALQYSYMPEPCRSCERKASDRYESKDKQ